MKRKRETEGEREGREGREEEKVRRGREGGDTYSHQVFIVRCFCEGAKRKCILVPFFFNEDHQAMNRPVVSVRTCLDLLLPFAFLYVMIFIFVPEIGIHQDKSKRNCWKFEQFKVTL